MQARLSIMGLYLYDNSIFDNFVVPTVDAQIYSNDTLVNNQLTFDKNKFLDQLLFECADLSCIYTNPATVKQMITVWSNMYNYNWCKLMTTAALKYNPIWNVDANVRNTDTDTDVAENSNTSTKTTTKSTTNSGTDTTNYGKKTTGTETNSGTDTTNSSKTTTSTETNTGDDITTYGKTDNITTSSTETFEPGTEDIDYYNQLPEDRTETTTTKIGSFNSNALSTQTEVSTVHPTKVIRHTSFGVGDKKTGSGTSAETLGGTDKLTHGHTINNTETMSGSDSLVHGHTINDTETLSGSDTFEHGHKIAESETVSVTDTGSSEVSKENIHTERRTGNIGVTTTQAMIEKEREIALFSIYDVVINSFKEHFCVLVY